MTRVVFISIDPPADAIAVLDAGRRLYVAVNRAGDAYHVISPRQVELTDVDGNVVAPAGSLACTCKGATFHGECYRLRQAVALERGEADVDVWIHDAAPGELTEMYGR